MNAKSKFYWSLVTIILYIGGICVALFNPFSVAVGSILAALMISVSMVIPMIIYPEGKNKKDDKKPN